MINFSLTSELYVCGLAGIGILQLLLVQKFLPKIVQDEDNAIIGCLCFYCYIIALYGWKLDPILLFTQFLAIGCLVLVIYKNIQLRCFLFDSWNRE